MNPLWKIWLIPFAMGLLTLIGLLSALLGLGVWQWLSWMAFTMVVGVVAFAFYLAKNSA